MLDMTYNVLVTMEATLRKLYIVVLSMLVAGMFRSAGLDIM